jgi:hypothetical protein
MKYNSTSSQDQLEKTVFIIGATSGIITRILKEYSSLVGYF